MVSLYTIYVLTNCADDHSKANGANLALADINDVDLQKLLIELNDAR